MKRAHDEHRLPDDVREVADMLGDRRPALDPLTLDRVKLRAMSAASRSTSTRDRGSFMKSRLTTLIAAAFLALSTGGAFALAGGGGSGGKDGGGSASFSQYRCEHSKGHAEGCEEGKEKDKGKGKDQGAGEGDGKGQGDGKSSGQGQAGGQGKGHDGGGERGHKGKGGKD
jgi:hypothetical protein